MSKCTCNAARRLEAVRAVVCPNCEGDGTALGCECAACDHVSNLAASHCPECGVPRACELCGGTGAVVVTDVEPLNPPPPASTPPDQEQGDTSDRLTSAIITDAATTLADCRKHITETAPDSELGRWIDDSIEVLTERAASLRDEMQPIDELELVARVRELEKALDIVVNGFPPSKTDEGQWIRRIARKALEGEGHE